MDEKLKKALYTEATTNGLNSKEYLAMIKAIDEAIDYHVNHSEWYRKGVAADDYDVNGKAVE